MRLSALALVPVLASYDFFVVSNLCVTTLCLNLWCALQLLVLYPLPHEDVKPSLAAFFLSLAVFISFKLLAVPLWLSVSAGSVIVFCFALHRSVCRFADVPPLFLVSTVWPGVLDYLCLFHMSAYLLAGALLCAFINWTGGLWALMVILSMFSGLQYYRIISNSTIFLGRRKESLIRQGQKVSGYKQPVQYVDSESRSAVLFNDVVKIMEVKKPYLQDDFALDDLSRLTRTNRLYLSKAINFHSGRNFNQLVNYYRVKYAVELIKKDANLKMSEIAEMSGFHTTVSFNMAFKLNEHTTPSEYARSLKKII